jgi:hypothetical protein
MLVIYLGIIICVRAATDSSGEGTALQNRIRMVSPVTAYYDLTKSYMEFQNVVVL